MRFLNCRKFGKIFVVKCESREQAVSFDFISSLLFVNLRLVTLSPANIQGLFDKKK